MVLRKRTAKKRGVRKESCVVPYPSCQEAEEQDLGLLGQLVACHTCHEPHCCISMYMGWSERWMSSSARREGVPLFTRPRRSSSSMAMPGSSLSPGLGGTLDCPGRGSPLTYEVGGQHQKLWATQS